jgi:hypothetical protein
MAEEMYFLYLDGVQRGPYTVFQIGHMVNAGIVHPDSLFWCEGLDQWQPVTQLIVPKSEIKRQRWRVSLGLLGGALAVACVLSFFWPVMRVLWREQHQVEKTPEAAYWRARGVLRERLGRFKVLRFSDFKGSRVRWVSPVEAVVEVEVLPRDLKQENPSRWLVKVRYDSRLKMWGATEESPALQP